MTAIRNISLGQHRENVNLHKNKHSYATETGLKTGFGFFQQNDALIFVNVFTFANLACSLKKKKRFTDIMSFLIALCLGHVQKAGCQTELIC